MDTMEKLKEIVEKLRGMSPLYEDFLNNSGQVRAQAAQTVRK